MGQCPWHNWTLSSVLGCFAARNMCRWKLSVLLLEAAEDKTAQEWNLFRGQTHLARGQFTKAAVCFLRVEDVYPRECWPLLEQCYRELEDYKQAYFYACKQRKSTV